MVAAFIGNVLRYELFSRYGRGQKILDESIGYLLYMADVPGTLWENDGAYASCDHGFASHAAHVCFRDMRGLYPVDRMHRQATIRISNRKMDWCEGTLPTAEGGIPLRWQRKGDKLHYRLSVPAGYQAQVENLTGAELAQEP